MKTNNFPYRPPATLVTRHSNTARTAVTRIIHRVAQVAVFETSRRSWHASSGSLVEVHLQNGQGEHVQASRHRGDATTGSGVRPAWQDIGPALRQSFALQDPSHMSARAYVQVRVTTGRRTRS